MTPPSAARPANIAPPGAGPGLPAFRSERTAVVELFAERFGPPEVFFSRAISLSILPARLPGRARGKSNAGPAPRRRGGAGFFRFARHLRAVLESSAEMDHRRVGAFAEERAKTTPAVWR